MLRSSSVASTVEDKVEAKAKAADTRKGKAKKRKHGKYEVAPPSYDLSTQIKEQAEIVLPRFVPPEKDRTLLFTGIKLHDVNGMKVG